MAKIVAAPKFIVLANACTPTKIHSTAADVTKRVHPTNVATNRAADLRATVNATRPPRSASPALVPAATDSPAATINASTCRAILNIAMNAAMLAMNCVRKEHALSGRVQAKKSHAIKAASTPQRTPCTAARVTRRAPRTKSAYRDNASTTMR
jgi:hypothetical protein